MLWSPCTEMSFVSALTQPVSFQHLVCEWDCACLLTAGVKNKATDTSAFFISLLRYCFSFAWDLVTDVSPPSCKNFLNTSCLDPENSKNCCFCQPHTTYRHNTEGISDEFGL